MTALVINCVAVINAYNNVCVSMVQRSDHSIQVQIPPWLRLVDYLTLTVVTSSQWPENIITSVAKECSTMG